jgi:hypothetical protein
MLHVQGVTRAIAIDGVFVLEPFTRWGNSEASYPFVFVAFLGASGVV